MDIKNLTTDKLSPPAPSASGYAAKIAGRNIPASASNDPGAEENLVLTPLARALTSAKADMSVPFAAARVAELKAAIAAGQYPIDNRRLADKIIALERELL